MRRKNNREKPMSFQGKRYRSREGPNNASGEVIEFQLILHSG